MERDPALYDRGYQFEKYDLVVLTIANWDETVRTIEAIHFVTLDTYYKYDRVWRVGRANRSRSPRTPLDVACHLCRQD